MSDELIVKLLEEIRDLLKLDADRTQEAIRNQQEAIAMQRRSVRRGKMNMLVLGGMLLIFMLFLAWLAANGK